MCIHASARALAGCLVLFAWPLAAAPLVAQGSYVNFESPQVHPATLTPDGTRLLVTNTADARLSVFDLALPSSPTLVAEIPVGIEPVSVRARTNDEAWVVNHTSDSVSIVSLSQGIVVDTIQVKDEPCDVVFAGSPQRAYVTASRSNDVRVIDVNSHLVIANIPVFGENPRALAVSSDGTKVFTAIALSGNRTTIVGDPANPLNQPPPTNPNLPAPPTVGIIVDATDPLWNLPYGLPDNDVVEIATATNTVSRYFTRVGTHNTGLAVHPSTGDLYVANTDARNLIRFETNLRGHVVDNRISRISIGTGSVTHFDLNQGLDYSQLPNPSALATALSQPMEIAFDAAGNHLYVASFGTDRIARLDVNGNVLARIEIGPSPGTAVDPRSKRGPRGLVVHPTNGRIYVVNRISNTVSVLFAATDMLVNEVPVGAFDPTPPTIRQGRGFLYDSKLSGNGTAACSSCHYDGDLDMLAWDLGDPGGDMVIVNNTVPILGNLTVPLHPMKGPMTTQTLKGLNAGQNPLHWRGDRPVFESFNPAFDKLLGGSQLPIADMTALRLFVETMRFEPNPHRNLDNSLPASVPGFAGNPQTGLTTFNNNQYQPLLTCNTCHVVSQGGQAPFVLPGNILQESQGFNIPHLRNMYQKTGFNNAPGAQSRTGFGFLHDGSFGTLTSFLSLPVFGNVTNDTVKKNDLQAFMLCFDTGTAPAVGFSLTVAAANANQAATVSSITLLQSQAASGNIDLIAKGLVDGALRGFQYLPAQAHYRSDKVGVGPFTWAQLQSKALAGNAVLSVMGVPPGSGVRMGIDRDLDGILDGDEPPVLPVSSFGASSPSCAGGLAMGTNSPPRVGNALFAFTCTQTAPSSLALALVANQVVLPGTPFLGFDLLVDLASSEVYAFDMGSDPTGFGVAPAPIANAPALIGLVYHAQTVSLAPCAPFGLAASQGITLTILPPF